MVLLSFAGQEPGTVQQSEARVCYAEMVRALEGVDWLKASYVQTRTSILLAEPIVSRGELYYRRTPACLVFDVTEPDPARIWLDERVYQVHRPARRSAERYLFSSNELSASLLRCFSPRAETIEALFELTDLVRAETLTTLRYRPVREKTRKFLRALELTVRTADHRVQRLVYTDGEGDVVAIELAEWTSGTDSSAADSEEAARIFSPGLPEGTRVFEHRVQEDG